MKRIFGILGACAVLGALSISAPAHANIIWGGGSNASISYNGTVLPAGTLIGISNASATQVYVWALTPGSTTAFIVAVEDKAIWGV